MFGVLPNNSFVSILWVNFSVYRQPERPSSYKLSTLASAGRNVISFSYKKRMTLLVSVSSAPSLQFPPMGKLYPVNYPAYSLTTPFTRTIQCAFPSDFLYSCRYYYNTTWHLSFYRLVNHGCHPTAEPEKTCCKGLEAKDDLTEERHTRR